VRLVLEYCDKGCLRNALDNGVFIMGKQGGLLVNPALRIHSRSSTTQPQELWDPVWCSGVM
jgi:hypothetical protein